MTDTLDELLQRRHTLRALDRILPSVGRSQWGVGTIDKSVLSQDQIGRDDLYKRCVLFVPGIRCCQISPLCRGR